LNARRGTMTVLAKAEATVESLVTAAKKAV
jgi:hypothetical protein